MECKFGNLKINKNTVIFNMSSATDCASKDLGLCTEIVNKEHGKLSHCYAAKAEMVFKAVLPYRRKQAEYWKTNNGQLIAHELLEQIKRKKYEVKYFRYNESGDFSTQEDVDKLNIIANELSKNNIITYGYSARKDLNFTKCKFIVRGSGWAAKNGQTKVLAKGEQRPVSTDKDIWVVCPNPRGECMNKCKLCGKEATTDARNINIAFHKH